jgi:hypothetical protein
MLGDDTISKIETGVGKAIEKYDMPSGSMP